MAALTLLTYALPPGFPTRLLAAAAKAGVIGGIADWFAITALFRRPLGLPIPHTAVIPRQKERLGRALGRFIAGHVFTREDVARFLNGLDLAGIIGRFLAGQETRRIATQGVAALLPSLLASIDDGRARRLLGRLIPRLVGGAGAGRVVARALRQLVAGGRHQEVFSFILHNLKEALAAREGRPHAHLPHRVLPQQPRPPSGHGRSIRAHR